MPDEQAVTPTPGTPVTINGTQYFLRYSWGTRNRLIKDLGGEDKLRAGLTGDHFGIVLLAGLKANEQLSDVTVEQLEELVDLREVKDIAQAMATAMGYKMASVSEVDAAGPTPVPDPSGG